LTFAALVSQSIADANDTDSLAKLRKNKLAAAKEWYEAAEVTYQAGSDGLSQLYAASISWKAAAYELALNKDERLAALTAHEARMESLHEKIHALALALVKGGEPGAENAAKVWMIEAQIWVLEEKAKP
jgi:hypothetical protein